ncbi:hypothetical protein MUDAN_DOGOELCO_01780 [Lactiplantibacillus mudanjiangensis]|uniref:abortive infection system toxin AbiGii family protein n=1 Tax=Lactiplantibacillus mudanjiangensis TaxID=1296538 RepID=UPI001015C48C|nr:abortive infection system toxin AbiGii family protein [Lactiplantibacillus mudanjiangensis]VDG32524.1 hypothetical protein MUDAN_DOGOELCO_01780 [Lactiplantibacillus mudanjiangensis]
MFSNARDELFPENRTNLIPSTILDGLLPESLRDTKVHYKGISQNSAILVSELEKVDFEFGGDIVKRVIEKVTSQYPNLSEKEVADNLDKVLFRTQTKLTINPQDEIYVAGVKIAAKDLVKNVVSGEGLIEFVIGPGNFRDPVEIKLTISGEPVSFMLQQQVYPSVEKQVFDTINRKILKLKLIIPDNKKEGVSVQFNIDLEAASSIEEIIEIEPLITMLIEKGDVALGGKQLPMNENGLSSLKPILAQLEIYKMMNTVGLAYKKEFPVRWKLTDDELNNLQMLYISITKNTFFEMQAYNFTFQANDIEKFNNNSEDEVSITTTGLENIKIAHHHFEGLNIIRVYHKYRLKSVDSGKARFIRTPNSKILVKVIRDDERIDNKKVAELINNYENNGS